MVRKRSSPDARHLLSERQIRALSQQTKVSGQPHDVGVNWIVLLEPPGSVTASEVVHLCDLLSACRTRGSADYFCPHDGVAPPRYWVWRVGQVGICSSAGGHVAEEDVRGLEGPRSSFLREFSGDGRFHRLTWFQATSGEESPAFFRGAHRHQAGTGAGHKVYAVEELGRRRLGCPMYIRVRVPDELRRNQSIERPRQ